jgi:hypothetical protein
MAIDRGQAKDEIDVEELLDELTSKIERLRVLYEQYFLGIEKIEPQTPRREVQRKMLDLQQLQLRNTALRYRFNMLNQKFGVYTTYWNRTLRAIENGTYYRDVARVGRIAAQSGEDVPDEVLRALPPRLRERVKKERERLSADKRKSDAAAAARVATDEASDFDSAADKTDPNILPPGMNARGAAVIADDDEHADIDQALDNLFGQAEEAVASVVAKPIARDPRVSTPPPLAKPPSTPPPAARPAPAPPPVAKPAPPTAARPALPPGVDERRAQDLYKKFVQAKKLLGEPTDHIKLEHVVATIAKQAPAIMKQHQAKGVDFEVVIKDDKVILKATPKK